MGVWITISEKKFPNGFQCLHAMALLDAQVQSTPQHHFDSSCKILFPLGNTMAMCPLITHNYLTASGHVTEEKLHCFMFPRENTAICSSILKHGQPPWLLGWDTASLLLEGPIMQAVWLTCLAYPAVLECLSSGSTALERAVDVSIECQKKGANNWQCLLYLQHSLSPFLTFMPFLGHRGKWSRNQVWLTFSFG